jgi:hypothetical protein
LFAIRAKRRIGDGAKPIPLFCGLILKGRGTSAFAGVKD